MKAATSLFTFLAILGAIASGIFYWLSKDQSAETLHRLEASQAQVSSLRNDLSDQREAHQALEAELERKSDTLDEARANATLVTSRVNQLKREATRYTNELEDRIMREEKLQREVADTKKELAKVRTSTIALSKVDAFERRIEELEAENLKLKNSTSRAASSGGTNSSGSSAAPEALRGKVLTVGPSSSFVILNVGASSGIKAEHGLSIERSGRTIAEVRITEVKENLSIARVLPESLVADVKVGDLVTSYR